MFTQCILVIMHNCERMLELFHPWELPFDLEKW